MANKAQVFGALAGPIGAGIFGVSLFIAGFIPPTPPTTDQAELVRLYAENATSIRVACIASLFLISGLMAQYSVLADQMKLIAGPETRSWAGIQVMLGGLSLVPVYGTSVAWALATYRPEQLPEVTQMLSDVGWFCFVFPVVAVLPQIWSIGFAVLSDRHSKPIFPRWYGYLCFWVAILLMPGLLIPFFKVGPFAWDGLLAFWIAAITLGTWINITGGLMLNVARRSELHES